MVEKAQNEARFVEIGSWVGKSAIYLAVEIINSKKHIQVDCIDVWSDEENANSNVLYWPWEKPEGQQILKNARQYQKEFDANAPEDASIYELFLRNTKRVQHILRPIRKDSHRAAKLYNDESLDFVFIDGDHIYKNVKQDIISWYPKVKIGGFLGGHDYNKWSIQPVKEKTKQCRAGWPGVKQAVNEFFQANELRIIKPAAWLIVKHEKQLRQKPVKIYI